MRSFTSMPLDDDIIDRILTFLPDFIALRAAILSSKVIYNIFQLHPQSIVRAIAYNIAGPALPQAMRVIRNRDPELVSEDLASDSDAASNAPNWTESDSISPISAEEARRLVIIAEAAKELETMFSVKHKDRTRPSGALSFTESWRFRRAIYRLMSYSQAFPAGKLEDDGWELLHDNADEIRKVRRARRKFFAKFAAFELAQIHSVVEFLKEVVTWIEVANAYFDSLPNSHDMALACGPLKILEGYKTDDMHCIRDVLDDAGYDEVPEYFVGYISIPLEELWEERKIKRPSTDGSHWKSILDTVEGENDACQRCNVVCGFNLSNETNWQYLKGATYTTREHLLLRLKGRLPRSVVEGSALAHLLSDPSFSFTKLLSEIHDIRKAQLASWTKEDWLCEACIGDILNEHLFLWLLECHKRAGDPIHEDCWYGYNCRTQTHSYHHASRLNHLCEPTRGD